jgi:hypothetical protein
MVSIVIVGVLRSLSPQEASSPELSEVPAVVVLGHARPVGGGPGRRGGGWYRHQIELLDGRKAEYVANHLYSPDACLEVHVKPWEGRLVVFSVTELRERCNADDLGRLTK